MTAIAGFTEEGKVYIGGDSAGVAGWSLTVRADEKVFRNGEFVFGFTTSFRMGQLLRYAFHPPTPKEDQDLYRFMVTDFIDAVRSCLKAGGYASKDKESESGGTFLVGFRGKLFSINGDYQVGQSADGYDAVGCGCELSCGAFFAMKDWDMKPRDRVLVALEAAERHSAGVRGPFHIEVA